MMSIVMMSVNKQSVAMVNVVLMCIAKVIVIIL
jgi:hypothetical protein